MQIALPVFMARNLTASPAEIKGLVRMEHEQQERAAAGGRPRDHKID
ncbi:MAG: hypothetical protein Q8L54_15780 [Devosia sp.]|nr:hypothetical protein [Devosia sp.]